jgi:hypothetical protein
LALGIRSFKEELTLGISSKRNSEFSAFSISSFEEEVLTLGSPRHQFL